MQDCCRIENDFIHLSVKAIPGASRTEFANIKDGQLRIRVAAAPEGGKANTELISFIAKALGCRKNGVTILRGEKSRQKIIALPLSCKVQLEKILGGE